MRICHAQSLSVRIWGCAAVDRSFVFYCEICHPVETTFAESRNEQNMLIARTFAEILSDNPWQRAYWIAVALTGFNAAVTMAVWGAGIESNVVNTIVAILICLVGGYCGARMIMSGALLGALPYFMIGSAIFYGAGTVFATLKPEPMALLSFTEDVQRAMLAKVNLANALSIFLVVASAGLLCANQRPAPRVQPGVRSVIDGLEGALPGMLIAAVATTCLIWATFPAPQDFVLLALVRVLRGLTFFTILLGAALWDRLQGPAKLMVILLVLAHLLFGMVSFVKALTLLPVVVLVLGWWMNGTMIRTAIVVGVITWLAYFGGFAELVALGRFHASYDPLLNSVPDRIRIMADTMDLFIDFREGEVRGNTELRFSTAPFQAYFMALYDTGFPGETLDRAQTILIPRVLWPEKPVFDPGSEFDLVFRGTASVSRLAIGFIAEGYWNLGWLGVIIVSLVVGVQIGWFTRKWFLFAEHGAWHLGIFLFAPLIVFASAWVEANFVGGYVGGTARMILMIMAVDVVARVIISQRRAQIGT